MPEIEYDLIYVLIVRIVLWVIVAIAMLLTLFQLSHLSKYVSAWRLCLGAQGQRMNRLGARAGPCRVCLAFSGLSSESEFYVFVTTLKRLCYGVWCS